MMLSPEQLDILTRHDLRTFAARCFRHLNLGLRMTRSSHHFAIADALERVLTGQCRRLIINLPPRQLKSLFASVALPAFWLGWYPSAQIVCISYGQSLSEQLARNCRNVMLSPWFERAFLTRLSPSKRSAEEFETTKGGFRFATSVGGVLTGRGGDVLIIDDPQKPDEVLSEANRFKTNSWYTNSLPTRLNNPQTGAIIIVMQRLHEDDLTGFVQGLEDWEVLRLPAIATADEYHVYDTISGPVTFKRKAGEALDPHRLPPHVLDQIKTSIGSYNFAGQYQQEPVPQAGGMVKREWFRSYRDADLPSYGEVIQSWDTANKVGDGNDYSVCTTWVMVGDNAYLRNVHRAKHEYPQLKRAVRDQQKLFKANVVLIEDKGSGTQLIQDLNHEHVYEVQPYVPRLGKQERMYSQTAMIEAGFVFVPETASWLEDYLHELAQFPRGKHDDQADSTSQFLEWLKIRQMFNSHQTLWGSYGRGGSR